MSRRNHKKLRDENVKVETDQPISFDQFFSSLIRKDLVQPHHKAPLKEFFKDLNKLEASEKEFLEMFSSY